MLSLTELRVSDTLVGNFLRLELMCALTITHGVNMAGLGGFAPMVAHPVVLKESGFHPVHKRTAMSTPRRVSVFPKATSNLVLCHDKPSTICLGFYWC